MKETNLRLLLIVFENKRNIPTRQFFIPWKVYIGSTLVVCKMIRLPSEYTMHSTNIIKTNKVRLFKTQFNL